LINPLFRAIINNHKFKTRKRLYANIHYPGIIASGGKPMICGKNCAIAILTLMILTGLGFYISQNYLLMPDGKPMILITNKAGDMSGMEQRSPKLDQPDMLLEMRGAAGSGCPAEEVLSEQQLGSLPQQTFKTRHTWSKDAETFSGPLLSDVLSLFCPGREFRELHLRALDGYAIDLNFPTVERYRPIVALTLNGERMRVRNKGHLWIMAPLDDYKVPARSLDELLIWQLYQITVNVTE